MKIRLTIITENNKPVEALGENPEEAVKIAWEMIFKLITPFSENEDKAYVENVEILRGEDDEGNN